jgi:hypothetical protein
VSVLSETGYLCNFTAADFNAFHGEETEPEPEPEGPTLDSVTPYNVTRQNSGTQDWTVTGTGLASHVDGDPETGGYEIYGVDSGAPRRIELVPGGTDTSFQFHTVGNVDLSADTYGIRLLGPPADGSQELAHLEDAFTVTT